MKNLALVLLLASLAGGCSTSGLGWYPSAVADESKFCSSECLDAWAASDCSVEWEAVPDSSTIGTCLSDNCASVALCPGYDGYWDPECYVDCVRAESPEFQDAVAVALSCDYPSPACR